MIMSHSSGVMSTFGDSGLLTTTSELSSEATSVELLTTTSELSSEADAGDDNF